MSYIIANRIDPKNPQYWTAPKGTAIYASCNWFTTNRKLAHRYPTERAARQAQKRNSVLRSCEIEQA